LPQEDQPSDAPIRDLTSGRDDQELGSRGGESRQARFELPLLKRVRLVSRQQELFGADPYKTAIRDVAEEDRGNLRSLRG
jgi:hypothetical protein